MAQDWIAVTAYTIDTPYEQEVKGLISGLEEHGVEYSLVGYKSVGDWRKNCQNKQKFIIDTLRKGNRPVVWLDADARLRAYPKLFDNYPCDVGLYKRLHTSKQKAQLNGSQYHWESGTMYYKPTGDVFEFLECQMKLFEMFDAGQFSIWPETAWFIDHFNSGVFNNGDIRFVVGELPVTYSYIQDTTHPDETPFKDDAVIIHTQASRRWKDEICRIYSTL